MAISGIRTRMLVNIEARMVLVNIVATRLLLRTRSGPKDPIVRGSIP